jgi:hypothetical protein
MHLGEEQLDIFQTAGLLASFSHAIAGANGTVSLPISQSDVAFQFSPLLSVVHAVAAPVLGQCFSDRHDHETSRSSPQYAKPRQPIAS